MPTAILILLLYFLLSNSVDSCPNAKLECGNRTYSYSYPFFTDSSPPGCRTFHKIQCLDLWPVVQFNNQGLFFPVKNISSVEKTIIVHDFYLVLSYTQFDCLLFYNFTAPIRRVNVSSLSVLAKSSRSSFNCSMVEQDYHRNSFCNLSDHAPCKNYDIFIYRMNQPKNAPPPPPSCFPQKIGLMFNWKLSFEEYDNLSLLSAGYSYDWEDRPDCFSCRITVTNGNAKEGPRNKQCLGKHKSRRVIIGVAVGAAVFLLGLVSIALYLQKKRRGFNGMLKKGDFVFESGKKNFGKKSLANNPLEIEERASDFLLFDFFQITNATNNFSAENKLGQGGFGPVYKGQLPNGQEIAVKRLARNSGQGLVEFKNEILVIAKLQHINLVKLLGYSIQGEEKILTYEFMPNKSLDFFIFDRTRGALLDWPMRFHIIEGVAQGLLYLHKHSRLKIIHRDLKASNILLDGYMNPKISDFGLARIFCTNEDQGNFTNKVAGTFGYISPEYAADGHFSIKSDVFSFGVLLLEIVSGKRNAGLNQYDDFLNLLGYAWEVWKKGRWLELVDPSLGDGYSMDQVMKCIHVALLCVQEKPGDRPAMWTVTTMLSNESTTALPVPKQPGFFNLRRRDEGDGSSEINETCSLNRMTVTDPSVR